jgi:hypothetical protein
VWQSDRDFIDIYKAAEEWRIKRLPSQIEDIAACRHGSRQSKREGGSAGVME